MLEIYIDGASAGNPGPSGIGIFMKGEGHFIKVSEGVGTHDNHHAEFIALVKALHMAKDLNPSIVSLRSDSKIVVSSIEKRYVKKVSYEQYLNEALPLIDSFPLFFVKWIPDQQNKAADVLAREGIRKNELH